MPSFQTEVEVKGPEERGEIPLWRPLQTAWGLHFNLQQPSLPSFTDEVVEGQSRKRLAQGHSLEMLELRFTLTFVETGLSPGEVTLQPERFPGVCVCVCVASLSLS